MSEYAAVPSTGKLKLKGVSNGRIDKKKKKKQKANDDQPGEAFKDSSVVLKKLDEQDQEAPAQPPQGARSPETPQLDESDNVKQHVKTEAEKRYDEQRRKRLEERLRKDGGKTHKERVEELNKYLSGLSEHHDMPKIGPG